MQVADRPRPLTLRQLARGDADYPAGLLDLRDPPAIFCVWSTLPRVTFEAARSVAIVGARAATPYGLGIARRLARDLAGRGITIVSGLAHGIDAAAHLGALEAGGRTLGVIASSFAHVTPSDHRELAARVAASFAVVSEVPEGGPFGRGAFVKRNRLVAALAAATVVVEATVESGALSTAAVARTLDRALFAVPADIDRPAARGTLQLLREGARVCADAGDVLAVLAAARDAADPDARLRAQLSSTPASIETLAAATGLSVPEALARLLDLQWSGLAVPHPGGRWSSR